MITILVGKSASGKDTMLKKMLKEGYEPIVSYTSRPMRDGETDGVEYHFVSKQRFLELRCLDFFMESRSYNTLVNGNPDTWYYGSPKVNACEKNYVAILDVEGAVKFIRYYGKENVEVIYLYVSDEERERRASLRGSFDKTEWDRRKKDDDVKFSEDIIQDLAYLAGNFRRIINE